MGALTAQAAPSITLLWNDNSTNEAGFKVERSTDGVTFTEIGQAEVDTPTYVDTNVNTTTQYKYRVRAFNVSGDSAYSNELSATVPTISTISDQTINEDGTTGALNFTVSDVNSSATLTVTATSSNVTLVPNASVVVAGSGGSRTVTVTPAANLSGTSTITLTVSNGLVTNTTSFVVTVNAVNDAPTISTVADRSTAEDTATSAISFTVGDIDNSASSLTMSATSSDQAVVANANIVFGGSGASRTVTITPVANANGPTTITLTVSDGTATASTTFVLTVTAVNDAPTISAISNPQTTPEDTVLGPINFTIGDVDTAIGSLTVTASSSQTSVATVSLGGSGASRTLTITPVANKNSSNGTPTISISVSDGTATTSTSFQLNITPVNDAPSIAGLVSKTINEDTSTSTNFTISDVDDPTGAGLSIVSATSSNTTLLPNANIVITGTGTGRTVTVTPAANQSGVATVTITVTDGTAQVSSSFGLTVNPINDAPTVSSISNQTVNEDTPTSALAFTIADAETAASSLTLIGTSSNTTLVPNANIVFGGSGGSRTVTVTPAANQSGTATITITTNDGSLSGSAAFTLTVNPVNDAPNLINAVINQTTTIGAPVGPLSFTIGDVETPAASLTLTRSSSNTTLIPVANIVFGGSGANRTVTVTPAAGQTGTATLVVGISDGTDTTNMAFDVTVIAQNDNDPTITNFSPQTIAEDANTGPIAFTVGDVETPAGSLNVGGVSSDTTLVPNANIVFGGSGANRTVTITPAANQSGSATISITVSDGSRTATKTFLLTVNAVNDLPTITTIANQTVLINGATAALPFTIGDVETAAASLTVSATSSNTTLVPNNPANLTLGGSGANRTILVTPASGQSGTATITVTVNDGTANTTTTFDVTVTPNTAPSITSILNQTIVVNSNTGPLGFTVSDAETSATTLTVTGTSSNTALVPDANVVISGTAGVRTVTVTPLTGQTGVTTITLTVSDGIATNTTTFTVTVNADTPPTISPISDQSIVSNSSTSPQPFTIGDAETVSTGLTVTTATSNITLISVSGIVITGTGANRNVTLTPNAGQTGTATITLTVSDGTLTTSTSFLLTVTAAPTQPNAAPSFQLQPTSQTASVGATILLSAIASGNPAPTFQWYKNGVAVAGATTSTLTFNAVALANAGSYTVVASNSLGSATSNAASLNVNGAPIFTTHPASQTVLAGANVTFSVVVVGGPAPTLQWRKDGAIIPGATATTYTINNAPLTATGSYDVVASNIAGTVTSNAAALVVNSTSYSGVYFGTFTGGGNWALYIRSNNTGTLIAYLPDRNSAIVQDLTINPDGSFSVTGTEVVAPSSGTQSAGTPRTAAAAATFTLSGRITAGRLNAELTGINKSLSGTVDSSSGPAQSMAGFYGAPALGATGGSIYTVVGSSGQVMTVTTTSTAVDGATGTLGSNGRLSTTTSGGSTLSLTITTGQSLSATYQPSGSSTPLSFTGVSDTTPVNTRLVNLSARSNAGSGSDTLIAGFTVSGSGTKSVLVRGNGPALTAYGVTGVLADPTVSIYSGTTSVVSNDDWNSATNATEIANAALALNTFALAQNSKDAAVLANLSEGTFTAQVSGKSGATGVALVEIYDAARTSSTRLINVSARTRVGTGSDVLIVGFSIEGNTSKQLLIRAIGPTLSTFNVSGVLTDPQISIVRQSNSATLQQNDNWGGTSTLKQAFTKANAFGLPDASKDAAVVITLEPGAYSVVVSGVNGTTGVALVEVYDLQ